MCSNLQHPFIYKNGKLCIQFWDFVPASPYLICPCPTVDTGVLQPVFSEDMLNGGTRSLLKLRLSPASYWHNHSLFLSFISSTGLASPWLRAQNPLPASFPVELKHVLSTCAGPASISINSPGKKIATQRFLLSPLYTMVVRLLT